MLPCYVVVTCYESENILQPERGRRRDNFGRPDCSPWSRRLSGDGVALAHALPITKMPPGDAASGEAEKVEWPAATRAKADAAHLSSGPVSDCYAIIVGAHCAVHAQQAGAESEHVEKASRHAQILVEMDHVVHLRLGREMRGKRRDQAPDREGERDPAGLQADQDHDAADQLHDNGDPGHQFGKRDAVTSEITRRACRAEHEEFGGAGPYEQAGQQQTSQRNGIASQIIHCVSPKRFLRGRQQTPDLKRLTTPFKKTNSPDSCYTSTLSEEKIPAWARPGPQLGWGFSYGRHRFAKTFRSDVTAGDWLDSGPELAAKVLNLAPARAQRWLGLFV
jgi:hypothetical protein